MFLSAESRYQGAWQETASRIRARDGVILGFIQLAAAIIAIALTRNAYTRNLEFATVVIGYAALACVLLSSHHDLIIGYLGDYQHDLYLATHRGDDGQKEDWPEWFRLKRGSKRQFERVMFARMVRDWGQFFIIALACGGSLYISWNAPTPAPSLFRTVTLWGSAGCSTISAVLIIWVNVVRARVVNTWKNSESVLKTSPPTQAATLDPKSGVETLPLKQAVTGDTKSVAKTPSSSQAITDKNGKT